MNPRYQSVTSADFEILSETLSPSPLPQPSAGRSITTHPTCVTMKYSLLLRKKRTNLFVLVQKAQFLLRHLLLQTCNLQKGKEQAHTLGNETPLPSLRTKN